jgi:arginyl-tRNA synthetase
MPDPLLDLRNAVESAAERLRDGEPGRSAPNLERPPKPELGDYSTNAAMLLAPGRGEPPREVAELLRDELGGRLGATAERIDVAGPGFLNLFLAERWYREGVAAVLEAGERFGAGVVAEGQRIQVEFVSANPTGPLTAAGGRHAAYGDSVARVLGLAGHDVQREYYVNDKGGQVRRFAESIAARVRGDDVPEDGYEGAYVEELARELSAEGVDAADLDRLEVVAAERMREAARATLERFGVRFDEWFSERSLYEGGQVEAALEELRGRGHIYDSEGAVWLRTSEFGDDKDRVLIRSDGEPTYFASDVAYHRDKLERGFDRLLNVLGADHHGYVARVKAALAALGADPDRFEALLMQLVHVVEGGQRAQMSKRRGEFVTLDELIGDIGTDAARFLMLQRSHDTTVDLDLELARRQSQDNPVYYVQYAHARIASILRKAGNEAVDGALSDLPATLDAPVEPSERALVKRLLEMPGEVLSAAEGRAPHRLCAYATATAADFHAFYRDCKVIGAEDDGAPPGTEAARLALCVATKRVIARTLDLLGVSAPERM